MDTNDTKKCRKFHCYLCDFKCSKQSNMNKHLITAKHIKRYKMIQNDTQKMPKNAENAKHICECGKKYMHHSGLWRHQKECSFPNNTINNIEDNNDEYDTNNYTDKELIIMLINDNKELRNMMMEQQTKMMEQQNLVLEIAKNGTHNTTNTNSHNKTFNLQIFLNETCKNAMNIMDFVEQIVLNLNDLEETGRIGFAEGISKMILKRLKNLDITERPIHCSDLKRETLYIKDENKWEKEQEGKPILTKAVKEIAGKNIKQIKDWQKKHPDYNDPTSRTSDKYMNMVMNVMAGGTEEEMQDNYEKVVKNIVKETTIAKEKYLT
jgi:hypothetical protein